MDDGLCSSYAVRRYSKTRSIFALTCTCTTVTLHSGTAASTASYSYSKLAPGDNSSDRALPCPSRSDGGFSCGPCLLCMHDMSLVPKDFHSILSHLSCSSAPAVSQLLLRPCNAFSRQMLLTAMEDIYMGNCLSWRVIFFMKQEGFEPLLKFY